MEELQAHRFGPHLVVNLTIGINGSLSVKQGDRIATNVELLIYESIPNIRHIDDILAETRRHVAEHESFVSELQESKVS